jgi:hypothetical protein
LEVVIMTARRVSIVAGMLLLVWAGIAAYWFFRSPEERNQPGKSPPEPVTTKAAPIPFPQGISVTANYPGANAQVVADTVAAPIEQQVNGVENMLYMSSQSNNDGSYTLDVTFKPGTDLNMAQVLVQNRVAVAEAKLPDEVKRQGVTTTKK